MKTIGKIVRRDAETAWVRVCHGEFCAGCGHHSAEDEIADILARNPIRADIGQHVEVVTDPRRMMAVMVLVFWLPLIFAGLLAWAGWKLSMVIGWTPEPIAAIFGVFGLIAAGILIHRTNKNWAAGSGLTIVRVLYDNREAIADRSDAENRSCTPSSILKEQS
jgi:hypothetical protein